MLRVGQLQRSIDFYTQVLGMTLLRTTQRPEQKYDLAFVGYGRNPEHAEIELTFNHGVEAYEIGTAFGHIAIGVADVAATCAAVRERAAALGGAIVAVWAARCWRTSRGMTSVSIVRVNRDTRALAAPRVVSTDDIAPSSSRPGQATGSRLHSCAPPPPPCNNFACIGFSKVMSQEGRVFKAVSARLHVSGRPSVQPEARLFALDD